MYKVIIDHGINPQEEHICKTEKEAIEKYFFCCFVSEYSRVRIEKIYEKDNNEII